MKALLFIIVMALSGCQLVTPQIVTTKVTKTADGTITIESPKDIKASFHQSPDGTITATYESRANSDALAAGSAESAARAAAVAKLAEAAASLR
jgi:hypothetical protein